MKKVFLFAVMALLITAPAAAGRDLRTLNSSSGASFRPGLPQGGFLGFPSRGNVPIGIFPVLDVPPEVATVVLLHHWLFGDSSAPISSPGSLYPGLWGYASFQSQPNYTSRSFVEEWKDRTPALEAPSTNRTESILLSEGMSQEGVMEFLGSPIQRIRLGEREVWKYSGYSLVFETGRLQAIH